MTERNFANGSARARAPATNQAELRTALRDDDPLLRRDAALALVDRAGDGGLEAETVAVLVECATSDDDPDVRQFAVETLGVAGRASDALVAALADPSEWVRAEAVVACSRVGGGDGRVRELATGDDSDVVRRNAVIGLAKRGEAGGDLLVDRLKHDRSPAVREYAAGFLPETDVETARGVRLLAALLARDPNVFVRAKAARGLGRYGTERAVEALEGHGVGDRSEDVKRTAERALASARGDDADTTAGDRRGAPGGGPGGRSNRPRNDGHGVPEGACDDPGHDERPGEGPDAPPTGDDPR